MECKKLIEVAMPIKEVSAESVRDKSIRHGHISTLHLWWARRPLPACRAIVFASLVPDPLDKNCPKEFKEAVAKLLVESEYRPYDNIPWTTVIDPMEDNLRNRLLMFIGKFSDKFIENQKDNKKTPAKDKLSDYSLIKWENKNNEGIINKARKLIWVSHNSNSDKTCKDLIDEFDKHYQSIKKAEKELYTVEDRHLESEKIKQKQKKLSSAIESFLERMPKVFDPFAGGGAIPLEASRLGCRSYGNDLNPVAHIIQRGSVEFPQKFGKPIKYSKSEFIKKYGKDEWDVQFDNGNIFHDTVSISNRLSFDVEYYSKKLLKLTEDEIGNYYPKDENGNKPIAYYWARTAKCSNPSCKFEIPLIGTKFLCNKPRKKVAFNLIPNEDTMTFDVEVKQGNAIRFDTDGTVKKSKATCPVCGSVNDTYYLKEISKTIGLGQKLIVVIKEGKNGKQYHVPTKKDILAAKIDKNLLADFLIPNEYMQKISDLVSGRGWGVEKWSELFSSRQLLAMQTLVEKLAEIKIELDAFNNDYSKVIITYLAILIDRISSRMTSYGLWHNKRETLEQPFGRQAIPMVYDYPESNLFAVSGGGALNQISWIVKYIDSESNSEFTTICRNASSGEIAQFEEKSIDSVVTDPPYYDAIAYADLSDFFYVWLKRTVSDIYPMNFAYPQTPKTEECTALKHHHHNSNEEAKQHFEKKLHQIFSAIQKQTKGLVSIMFAHQTTEAWTTVCNSVLNSAMNISGTWANDTEMTHALKSNKAFLSSSVTVACRPSIKEGFGDFREIKKAITDKVKNEVKTLYEYGFRGADLLTACFGQAVSEFGKYEIVEKGDGTEVTVAELLEMTREAAFNAIISDIDADDITKFYIGWLNLFGFSEAEHDDVMRITQIGLKIEMNELLNNHILVRKGNMESLTDYSSRVKVNEKLGNNKASLMVDKVHKAMWLYSAGNRKNLVKFIAKQASTQEDSFWRVLNSFAEILPAGIDDHKQVLGLLNDQDSLIKDAMSITEDGAEQLELDF